MLSLKDRINLLDKLREYIQSDEEEWQNAKDIATNRNSWFTPESIDNAVNNIAEHYLQKQLLTDWAAKYQQAKEPKKVGIVMAGNIPLVGFHDFLSVFVSGHISVIKPSSKDDILIKNIIKKLVEWNTEVEHMVVISENLKNCDAYIATGSNNTSRYFEQYFGKYPNIIRKNKTSVAILTGNESAEELHALGKDIFTYYGLGCRNVTKVFLPENYDIQRLLDGLNGYKNVSNHHKYMNNYDYHLAIYLLNRVPYLTNDFLLMIENKEHFSPVSSLYYEFYTDKNILADSLQKDERVQAVIDNELIKFGTGQAPALDDYADGVDTMMFLSSL